jgi:hypothetical protein
MRMVTQDKQLKDYTKAAQAMSGVRYLPILYEGSHAF